MCRDREIAKDLLGETVAAAYQGFDRIHEEKALLSWLFTVASRLYYRMSKKNKNVPLDDCRLDQLITTDCNPEMLSDIAYMYENLNRLPEEQKEAIILFNIEGFSRNEIAKMQNVSEETVKSRLSRGRKKLATLMGADDE
jgi:RNA polymerase sigma-70 factor, ECF subfamily